MKLASFDSSCRFAAVVIVFSFAIAAAAGALAQKPASKGAESKERILLAINEGGAGNLDATEILLRYEDLARILEKALGRPVVIVAVRERKALADGIKRNAYPFVLTRPVDLPAEAIRDHGYQSVVSAKESSQAVFIVPKNSPLKSINDVKGKSIVTPDLYSSMWRLANAMLRDNNITLSKEKVRAMRDQAAIGWSTENGFFDVGVVNSVSGVGRTWEKNGGRIIARSPATPNMPFIASPQVSAAQIRRVRAALVALDSTDSGKAVLKKIGITGFKDTPAQEYLDLLKWLGDVEVPKP